MAPRQGAGRIALHDDEVGFFCRQNGMKSLQQASQQNSQRLVFLHHIEIEVGLKVEPLPCGGAHFPVLPGMDQAKCGHLAQRVSYRRQLDDFGTRTCHN
ncbi:MAG: hypothetical protein IPN33_18325 [Saprospiraceae bacterium]|nr:hypothetical protein [Saprospiraceae bacterium]